MMDPAKLYHHMLDRGVGLFTGVPDSLMKSFLGCIQENSAPGQHVITANEGLAVGLATGFYFSTEKLPLVYLQNSGLGNIINPITSLADKAMYAVPMLLMIGWRGRPGTKDEPQHKRMGEITKAMLEVLNIPVFEIDPGDNDFKKIDEAIDQAWLLKAPVALLVAEGSFDNRPAVIERNSYTLVRERVIAGIVENANADDIVVCTTGKTGREFYEQNKMHGNRIARYFLSVGAMGHANHIALGLQYGARSRVIMLDGDGALLMHLGGMPLIARSANENFIHIVINNGSHESVGGQPTGALDIDLNEIARACGYSQTYLIEDEMQMMEWLENGFKENHQQFVEIRTNNDSRSDLGRPGGTPLEWKDSLMQSLKSQE
jgi:phosphonopyruvate decarboxylase